MQLDGDSGGWSRTAGPARGRGARQRLRCRAGAGRNPARRPTRMARPRLAGRAEGPGDSDGGCTLLSVPRKLELERGALDHPSLALAGNPSCRRLMSAGEPQHSRRWRQRRRRWRQRRHRPRLQWQAQRRAWQRQPSGRPRHGGCSRPRRGASGRPCGSPRRSAGTPAPRSRRATGKCDSPAPRCAARCHARRAQRLR
jgi:hypothetical protein